MLIMNSPGRLVLPRRDRDRAGSGGKRAPDPKAQIVVPVVGSVPVAVVAHCGDDDSAPETR
jgi:hypothetical protein